MLSLRGIPLFGWRGPAVFSADMRLSGKIATIRELWSSFFAGRAASYGPIEKMG